MFPHQQAVIQVLHTHFQSDKSTTHAEVPKLTLSSKWDQQTLDASFSGLWQKQATMRDFQKMIHAHADKSSGKRQQTLSFGSAV